MTMYTQPPLLPETATVEEIIETVNLVIQQITPEIAVVDIVDDLAKHPTKTYRMRGLKDIKQILYHHVGDPGGADVSPYNTAWFHVHRRDWPGIGYGFYIGKDGTIYQTQRLHTVSYHCGGQCNVTSLGVCLEGSFIKGRVPTDAQLEAARFLNEDLLRMLGLDESAIKGHKEVGKTACPGTTFGQWKDKLVP